MSRPDIFLCLPVPLLALALSAAPALCQESNAGADGEATIGRPATAAEISAIDRWISPTGEGLPPGGGSVSEGEDIYLQRCAECHGLEGRGGQYDALVGGRGTLLSESPVRTVESYWPYATTIFDYVRRAMPYDLPGTLSDDQVYAVVAYVLHLAELLDADGRLDAQSLPEVRMPNRDAFLDYSTHADSLDSAGGR
jgi:cytochrome c